MSVEVNLRHLEKGPVSLNGELPPEDLDVEGFDDLIQVTLPLKYKLEVDKQEAGLLVVGQLSLFIDCECARCLKPFRHRIHLDAWQILVPIEGEDAAPIRGDCVDLTPYLREDIVLGFPQQPLCEPECRGLPQAATKPAKSAGGAGEAAGAPSPWAELNRLKF